MLEPIVNFFVRMFQLVGRGIGMIIGLILWPFMWFFRWLGERNIILKAVFGALIVGLVALYGYFFYVTQFWFNFNPDYPTAEIAAAKEATAKRTLAGDPAAPAAQAQAAPGSATQPEPGRDGEGAGSPATPPAANPPAAAATCNPSAIVAVSADLIDFNVNQNAWVPSMILSKLGLFGIEWKNTPFLDNKAAFQLGIAQVMRRTTTELVDTLGRVRGTSQIDQNLQDARNNAAYGETIWYWTSTGPQTPTPSVFRRAIGQLRAFNDSLAKCNATFDARADNLQQFLDRIAGDIGSTSDILQGQINASDAGWLDPRADDRFWFAYGQLYAYYGILTAARTDFAGVIAERNLTQIWDRMQSQLRTSLNMQPWIISNGNESSAIFPSHLATMGFNLLRTRSQLVEIRLVLDR